MAPPTQREDLPWTTASSGTCLQLTLVSTSLDRGFFSFLFFSFSVQAQKYWGHVRNSGLCVHVPTVFSKNFFQSCLFPIHVKHWHRFHCDTMWSEKVTWFSYKTTESALTVKSQVFLLFLLSNHNTFAFKTIRHSVISHVVFFIINNKIKWKKSKLNQMLSLLALVRFNIHWHTGYK